MFTTLDKALAALVVPVVTLLVLRGLLPESEAQLWIEIATVILGALAVYFVPNRES